MTFEFDVFVVFLDMEVDNFRMLRLLPLVVFVLELLFKASAKSLFAAGGDGL